MSHIQTPSSLASIRIPAASASKNWIIPSSVRPRPSVSFPGLPIYASKDLRSWKLVSYAFNRREQFPDFAKVQQTQDGAFAPTLRYHEGKFYVITSIVEIGLLNIQNIIFSTANLFENSAWNEAVQLPSLLNIDPSLFWNDDGKVYVNSSKFLPPGIAQQLISPQE
jgi:beta-xylosidase